MHATQEEHRSVGRSPKLTTRGDVDSIGNDSNRLAKTHSPNVEILTF
jgi:hypothetical protein